MKIILNNVENESGPGLLGMVNAARDAMSYEAKQRSSGDVDILKDMGFRLDGRFYSVRFNKSSVSVRHHTEMDLATGVTYPLEMAKHTTGPWGYQVPMGPEILSIVTNPDGEAYEWVHVAQIGTDPVEGEAPIPFAEHEANARLIAAAPDMLVALLAAELVLSQGAAREGSLVLLGIRAALAKAQGK